MKAAFKAVAAGSFTKVEILVATAVLCLLCVMLAGIVNNTSNAWRGQEGRQEGLREATAALAVIARDVRNAVVSTNAAWFYSSPTNVAFLSCLPQNAQEPGALGDICIVGYSLEWGKANPQDAGESNRMALYRYVRFSGATYATLLSGSGAITDVFAGPDGTNTVREVLARNVSRMSCAAYSTNAAGGPAPFALPDAFPPILDFSISTLNEGTAAKLSTPAQWTATNSPLVRQNEETYSLRVRPGRS